jgi:hypothetical protein
MSTVATRHLTRSALWIAPGFSGSAVTVLYEEWKSLQKPGTPETRSDFRVADTLNQIADYLRLEPDWDLEEALPIDRGAAGLAAQIVGLVEHAAWQQGIPWRPPDVGPDPEGGIDLVWGGSGRRALLMARPHQSNTLDCVTTEAGGLPFRQTVSIPDAVRYALWALSSV